MQCLRNLFRSFHTPLRKPYQGSLHNEREQSCCFAQVTIAAENTILTGGNRRAVDSQETAKVSGL